MEEKETKKEEIRILTTRSEADAEILRSKSRPVEPTDDIDGIFDKLTKALKMSGGVGLGAVQIGIAVQALVIEDHQQLYRIYNPKILYLGSEHTVTEGCLSIPGKRYKKVRYDAITIEDPINGRIVLTGLAAQALQHELDHFHGILLCDTAAEVKKHGVNKATQSKRKTRNKAQKRSRRKNRK